jgi:hypothetical protein
MNKVKKSSGRNDSSDPPGSGYQMNTAVGFEWQSAFQALPQTLAIGFRQRDAISSCRSLTVKAGRPVIIEIDEYGRRIQSGNLHCLQSGVSEQVFHRPWIADRKLLAFVMIGAVGEQFGDCVPEIAHELHFA